MRKIAVTGGSGGAGRHVVRHLIEKGYEVRNLDVVAPAEHLCPFVKVDLTDYGATFAALHGADAAVHFGSSPHPDFDFVTGAERFRNNTLATYDVFEAAVALGMKRVVWASSETVLGFPFDNVRPEYLPVDEAHPLLPQNSYALSKVACEELARRVLGFEPQYSWRNVLPEDER